VRAEGGENLPRRFRTRRLAMTHERRAGSSLLYNGRLWHVDPKGGTPAERGRCRTRAGQEPNSRGDRRPSSPVRSWRGGKIRSASRPGTRYTQQVGRPNLRSPNLLMEDPETWHSCPCAIRGKEIQGWRPQDGKGDGKGNVTRPDAEKAAGSRSFSTEN